MEFILKKPVDIDGEKTEKINYNFEDLKGKDVIEVFNELRENRHAVTGAYEMDPVVGGAFFAKASGLDINDISLLKGSDYVRCSSLSKDLFKAGYKDIDLDSNVLNLSKIISIDNDDKNAINFDFDELTGQDIISTIDELRKYKYVVTGSYEMDPVVCASLFAKASNIGIDVINKLNVVDYLRASNLGRIFFVRNSDGGQVNETSEK